MMLEYSLTIRLLTEHHFEFQSLKLGSTGTCQNVTLLEMTFLSSIYFVNILMIVEVGMTMYLYFVSCTSKIDLTASDKLYLCHICYCNEKIYFDHMNNPVFVYVKQRHRSAAWQYPPPPPHRSVPLFH